MRSDRHTQSPVILRRAAEFRAAFVRAHDWAAFSKPAFIGVVSGWALFGYAGWWVARDWRPEWLGMGLLMLGMLLVASCIDPLRSVRGARALRRLGEATSSTLDDAKRKWLAEHFGVAPSEFTHLAHQLSSWQHMASALRVVGVPAPKPNSHSMASASHRATSWATALVAVTIPLMAARQEVLEFVFTNRVPLTVIWVVATAYALLLFRGIPALFETGREILGQMGLAGRAWSLEFLLRELVRLAEPAGSVRTPPRRVAEEAWLPL